MTACLFCETTGAVTFDLYVPVVDETATIRVCQDHLRQLRESDGRGDCAFCDTYRDHQFPERNVTESDCAPFALCRDHWFPIKEEVQELIEA